MTLHSTYLAKQKTFWDVASLEDAMFKRIYTDTTIQDLPFEEKLRVWEDSGRSDMAEILDDIPHQPEWSALEIGCGIGRLVKPFRAQFHQVDGIDISAKMIEFAKTYLSTSPNGQLFVNNGADLSDLSDTRYNLVFSTLVFQHIRSLTIVKSYFRDIFRVLIEGGYFRLQVHVKNTSHYGDVTDEPSEDTTHGFSGNGYDIADISALVSTHGFILKKVEEVHPWIWITAQRPTR